MQECPEHPSNALRVEVDTLKKEIERLKAVGWNLPLPSAPATGYAVVE